MIIYFSIALLYSLLISIVFTIMNDKNKQIIYDAIKAKEVPLIVILILATLIGGLLWPLTMMLVLFIAFSKKPII